MHVSHVSDYIQYIVSSDENIYVTDLTDFQFGIMIDYEIF